MTHSRTLPSTFSHACTLALSLACMPAPTLAQTDAPKGTYECRYNGSPRPGLNFTLLEGGRYSDTNGTEGTLTVEGAQITFVDGGLKDLRAIYKGGNPPTFNLMGPNDALVVVCRLAPG
jgi:hypothetical protein